MSGRPRGQSYVYAENDRLTWNLNESQFQSRNWTYNATTDDLETSFKVNLPIKTRYTSEWIGFEAINRNSYQHVSNTPYQSTQDILSRYEIRPVYYKKAWLPAAGWAMRIGGSVARNVIPPIIQRCFSNLSCRSGAAVVAAHLCIINYGGNLFSLPKGICSRAKEDGFEKDADGKYKKKGNFKATKIGGLAIFPQYNAGWQDSVHNTREQAVAVIKAHCPKITDSSAGPVKLVGIDENYGSGTLVACEYVSKTNGFYHALFGILEQKIEQDLQMVDITNFAYEDAKQNPNDYMNNPALKATSEAKITGAAYESTGGGGTFSVYGSQPYRNPQTGKTVQDVML